MSEFELEKKKQDKQDRKEFKETLVAWDLCPFSQKIINFTEDFSEVIKF